MRDRPRFGRGARRASARTQFPLSKRRLLFCRCWRKLGFSGLPVFSAPAGPCGAPLGRRWRFNAWLWCPLRLAARLRLRRGWWLSRFPATPDLLGSHRRQAELCLAGKAYVRQHRGHSRTGRHEGRDRRLPKLEPGDTSLGSREPRPQIFERGHERAPNCRRVSSRTRSCAELGDDARFPKVTMRVADLPGSALVA